MLTREREFHLRPPPREALKPLANHDPTSKRRPFPSSGRSKWSASFEARQLCWFTGTASHIGLDFLIYRSWGTFQGIVRGMFRWGPVENQRFKPFQIVTYGHLSGSMMDSISLSSMYATIISSLQSLDRPLAGIGISPGGFQIPPCRQPL